ncbi:hypothetical protein M513_09409 [Trichuris suis]|nr:hypothetical protein M513_09409 [Trichuris suis]
MERKSLSTYALEGSGWKVTCWKCSMCLKSAYTCFPELPALSADVSGFKLGQGLLCKSDGKIVITGHRRDDGLWALHMHVKRLATFSMAASSSETGSLQCSLDIKTSDMYHPFFRSMELP